VAKEAKQKEAKDKKAAAAARKADGLAKKKGKRISSAKAKASTVAAKAESLRSKLADVNKFLLPPSWGHQLINKLYNIVHKQWIYCNTFIHYRGSDGLTLPEHHDIINRMEEHAFTDPESLLPQHRFLLETDFEALGSGPSTQRLLWLANFDSTITASALAWSGSLTPAAIAHFDTVE
jgi:hypothetical protein